MTSPDARPCPRCGKPQPPDSVHTCSPQRPDARPVGETADPATLPAVVLAVYEQVYGELTRLGVDRELTRELAAQVKVAYHAGEQSARAALLRDAPALWVEVRENGDVFLREVDQRTREPFGPSYEAMHPFHAVGDILAPGEAAAVRLCKEATPT